MKWIRISLLLIAPTVLVLWLALYSINCPIGDEWALAPIVQKSYEGSLTFQDLWKPHNEHRVVFPKFILLQIVRWSRWNVGYELALNVGLGICIFLLLLHLLKRSRFESKWLPGIISVMVFSLNQSENWFNGWQMQIFLNVFAVLMGIAVLTRNVTGWLHVIAAILLGIVATFSFAGGILFWPIGFLILCVRRAGAAKLSVWIALTVVILIAYLYGYSKPAYHPSFSESLSHPFLYLSYVGTYLGSPLAAFTRKFAALDQMPAIVGFAGIVILASCLLRIRAERLLSAEQLLPFVAAAGYSVLAAFLSGFGRAGLGIVNALSLRYVTISSFLWITDAVLLYHLISHREKQKIPIFLLSGILSLTVLNSVYGALYARKQYYFLLPAKQELLRLEDDELLKRLHYDPDTLRPHVEMLRKYRLSVFRYP